MSLKLKLEVDLKATLQNIDIFCDKAENMLKKNNLEDYVFPVQMLLREALTNAVVHGCRTNPDFIIKTYFEIFNECIIIVIEDPGDGFDWIHCNDSGYSLPANSGRGLLILQKYASEYNYNKIGNVIRIIKKIVHKE